MYVLVDKTEKAIVYRHEKVETLRALANIELSHRKVAILDEDNKQAFLGFEVYFLQELFKALTNGVNPHSHNAEYLAGQVMRLCKTAPVASVDAFEASVQAMQIKFHDKDFYRYAKGSSYAQHLEDPFNPPPILGNWQAAQALPLPSPQSAPPAPVIAQPWAPAPNATPPKYAPPWA